MEFGKPPAWYLDIEGKRTGPYATDQIEGLIRERQIPLTARLTAPELKGRWVTAEEFLGIFAAKPEAPMPVSAPTQTQTQASTTGVAPATDGATQTGMRKLPPRPTDVESPTGFISRETKASDTTQHLFDALQAVRERKVATPTTRGPSAQDEAEQFAAAAQTTSGNSKMTPQTRMLASLALVAFASICGTLLITSGGGGTGKDAKDTKDKKDTAAETSHTNTDRSTASTPSASSAGTSNSANHAAAPAKAAPQGNVPGRGAPQDPLANSMFAPASAAPGGMRGRLQPVRPGVPRGGDADAPQIVDHNRTDEEQVTPEARTERERAAENTADESRALKAEADRGPREPASEGEGPNPNGGDAPPAIDHDQ